MSDGGKGSKARPYSISKEEFDNRWDNIFKKSPQEIQDAQLEDEAFKIIEDRMKNETGKV
jgi:hypothetical protein